MKWCRAEMTLYLIIATLGIGSMITACGQKGPLYKASINSSLEPKKSVEQADVEHS